MKPSRIIDLRSDTVTRPTPQMLEAMFSARVGDDVFEEDPTVNELQEKAARLFGMEAALFCASGTQTNQIAVKAHTSPPGEVILDHTSHIYLYEGGGIAFNSGCSVALIEGDRGRISAAQVEARVNGDNVHYPSSQLVCVENTANRGGGAVYDFLAFIGIKEVCRKYRMPLHLDGARLFNALAVTQETPHEYGGIFDSISICLSKGLGAPVGSLLLGNKNYIKKARRLRKVLGGGMRQVGYLAAAGIYALDHHISRLGEDHAHARILGEALAEQEYVGAVLPVQTNIVVADLHQTWAVPAYLEYLKSKGVLAVPFGGQAVRFVTHLDISDAHLDQALEAIRSFGR